MTIELKVRKVGNSLALILPSEVLSHLKVDEGDQLFLTKSPDGGFRITPVNPAAALQVNAAEKVIKRYRNTLGELAK